jgi:hypothetical protein
MKRKKEEKKEKIREKKNPRTVIPDEGPKGRSSGIYKII